MLKRVYLCMCLMVILSGIKVFASETDNMVTIVGRGNVFNLSLEELGVLNRGSFTFTSISTFNKAVDNLLSKNTVEATDAKIVETDHGFEIEEGTLGSEINLDRAKEYLKYRILNKLRQSPNTGKLVIKLTEDCFKKSKINNESLSKLCESYNKFYKKEVKYFFGEEVVSLDFSTIRDWIYENEEGTDVVLDWDRVREWVRTLKVGHDTAYVDRVFSSTLRGDVSISYAVNTYGYLINLDAETEELYNCLMDDQPLHEREPVYDMVGSYGRNYNDDLMGNYVEVDIQNQTVFYYKDHELITTGQCVTGDVSKGRDTDVGVYVIQSKESPATLRGYNSDGSLNYASPVTYWMPFNGGEGLHDASWRYQFGGSIYQYDGSHGCVNLPFDVAEQIYYNAGIGTPVVVF